MSERHSEPFSSDESTPQGGAFAVSLDVFSGPFEVLLSLISRNKLDITEVALAQVTDEFLAFVAEQAESDLSKVSEFLVVAATLLDLKAARLLPHDETDEEDIELLEARDLLFAKLLQYRAFKDVAADLASRLSSQTLYVPRDVALEPEFKGLLPEVELGISPDYLAMLAAQAITRREPTITFDHIHNPLVSVESQVAVIREKISVGDRMSFNELCRDAHDVPTVISRFLAVLELLRQGQVQVEQENALKPFVILRVAEQAVLNDEIPVEPHPDGDEAGSADVTSDKAIESSDQRVDDEPR